MRDGIADPKNATGDAFLTVDLLKLFAVDGGFFFFFLSFVFFSFLFFSFLFYSILFFFEWFGSHFFIIF